MKGNSFKQIDAEMRLIAAGLLIVLALVTNDLRAQTLTKPVSTPTSQPGVNFVRSVAVDGLIEQPAHFFDLQGKTLRFTPQGDNSYKVEALNTSTAAPCDKTLDDKSAEGGYFIKGWSLPLPFSFPFAGKKWDRIYVNRNGNISFEKSEADYWSGRDPWSDGGMRSVAAAIDSRSAAGLEQMIAVFWAHVDPDPKRIDIRVKLERNSLAITWNVMHVAWGEARAGSNTFQARLFSSGVIEMVYPHIVDRDGIVGLFTGQAVNGKQLHHWQFNGKTLDPSVAIDSADIYDAGSVLKFVMNMKQDAITHINQGTSLEYRCFVHVQNSTSQVSVAVTDGLQMSCWLDSAPRTGGFQIHGKSVVMYVSKVLLPDSGKLTPEWNVVWWGKPGWDCSSGPNVPSVDLSCAVAGQVDLSSANGTHSGNIFEVFHYPAVSKSSESILKIIYQRAPAEDDIALVFTDFRIDDLYGQGGGAIAANFRIRGIGPVQDHPRSTAEIGSKQLQISIATQWIGAPNFNETGSDDNRNWFNFAHGVKWIAHESTHRWGIGLSFRNPQTGQVEKLADGVGHWLDNLNTTAMYPMSGRFLGQGMPGPSIMGGSAWRENSDGTFSRTNYPNGVPGGYSALDLYILGMLPPEKVPDTFLLQDMKDLGNNHFKATKVPVRIGDVVAAMGPRVPASGEAQKTFKMMVYVVHEPGREVEPATLARTRRVITAVVDFFSRATGGVMKVVPSHP